MAAPVKKKVHTKGKPAKPRTSDQNGTNKTVAKKGKGKMATSFTYGRVSSQKQIDGAGLPRQRQAALHQAKLVLGSSAAAVPEQAEVVSGCKPLESRKVLSALMQQKDVKIFIENARAIARSAKVGEDIYEAAKKHNISIVPDDIPNLFALQPKPSEAFIRVIMLAVYQLERDLIVERLAHGLQKAKQVSQKISQKGCKKVNGSKSWLEKKPPSKKQLAKLRKIVKAKNNGKLTWREVQGEFRTILRNRGLGLHTVMRQFTELEVRFPRKR